MNYDFIKHKPNGDFAKGPWKEANCSCLNCGKKFRTKPSRIAIGKGKYCSRKCKGIGQSKNWSNESNPHWKGGKVVSRGYVLVKTNEEREKYYTEEHRLIMEKHIGRDLTNIEVVHHINGNKKDNRIENLMLLESQSEHAKIHYRKGDYRFG